MVKFGNPTCPETRLKHNVFNDLVSFGKDETLNPETNALSMLSYGRAVDSKGLTKSADCSNWPTVPEIVPGISSRRFPASFGDRVTDTSTSNFPL